MLEFLTMLSVCFLVMTLSIAACWCREHQRLLKVSASEKELRTVIDLAPDGIVYVNSDGIVESVNRAAAVLLGYEKEEMVGNSVLPFMPEVYKHHIGEFGAERFEVVVEPLIGHATEVVVQRKDGSSFPLELSVGRLDVGGREIFIGIIRDISDRKHMEKRVSEFYSMISHELRSPLASVRGSLGLIEGGAMGDVSAEVIELVQIGKKNCDRLIRLINDILDAKKIEAGRLKLQVRSLNAAEIISLAVEGLQSFAAEANVSIVALSVQCPPVLGDEDRIVQVLTNLLSNAIKYSPSGSSVDVFVDTASLGEHYARFCVMDRGPGINPADIPKLFSEFQQLDSSDTRSKGGTGLGLAISKSIIEQMGGRIGVDNSCAGGATFWFELPLAVGALPRRAP